MLLMQIVFIAGVLLATSSATDPGYMDDNGACHQSNANGMACEGARASFQSTGCVSGYEDFQGACYQFNAQGKPWDQARESCQRSGGDLVVVDTTAKQLAVTAFIKGPGSVVQTWIGGSQMPVAHTPVRWLDGSTIDEILFADSIVSKLNQDNTQCVLLSTALIASRRALDVGACISPSAFMCEKKCEDGWFDSQYGTCYKFSDGQKTYEQATFACAAMDAKLVVLDTAERIANMNTLITNAGKTGDKYFVGGKQEPDALGAFQWFTDASVADDLFNTGKPGHTDFTNQQCLVFTPGANLEDKACTSTSFYICEKPMP